MGQSTVATVSWGYIIPNNKLCDVLEAARKDKIEGRLIYGVDDSEDDSEENIDKENDTEDKEGESKKIRDEDHAKQHEKMNEEEREKEPPLEKDWYKVKVEKADMDKSSSQAGQASALESQFDLKTESVAREWRQLTQSGLQAFQDVSQTLDWNSDSFFIMRLAPRDDARCDINEVQAVVECNPAYGACVWGRGYDVTKFTDLDELPTRDEMNEVMSRPENAKKVKWLRKILHVDELGVELKGRWLLVLNID